MSSVASNAPVKFQELVLAWAQQAYSINPAERAAILSKEAAALSSFETLGLNSLADPQLRAVLEGECARLESLSLSEDRCYEVQIQKFYAAAEERCSAAVVSATEDPWSGKEKQKQLQEEEENFFTSDVRLELVVKNRMVVIEGAEAVATELRGQNLALGPVTPSGSMQLWCDGPENVWMCKRKFLVQPPRTKAKGAGEKEKEKEKCHQKEGDAAPEDPVEEEEDDDDLQNTEPNSTVIDVVCFDENTFSIQKIRRTLLPAEASDPAVEIPFGGIHYTALS